MIDMDDVILYVKLYYRVAIGVLVLIVLFLCFWLFRGYGGREEVTQKIAEIKQTSEHNVTRVDDIIDATKTKEEAAKRETADLVSAVSADALPDLLAGLLADYRKNGR